MNDIHNTHNQLVAAVESGVIPKEKAIAVMYAPRHSVISGRSQVYSPFFKTDPESAWFDYGRKSFSGKKSESMLPARLWASNKYGITSWKINRSKDFVPTEVQNAFPIQK